MQMSSYDQKNKFRMSHMVTYKMFQNWRSWHNLVVMVFHQYGLSLAVKELGELLALSIQCSS